MDAKMAAFGIESAMSGVCRRVIEHLQRIGLQCLLEQRLNARRAAWNWR